jgi:tryptophanyl-tRNA synthetase
VPVSWHGPTEDQIPNVELARSIARKFNARFGQTFVIPEMLNEMVKVPGLDGEKMGKSEADNAVDIASPMDTIRERYMRQGVTDPARRLRTDKGDPFVCRSIYPLHEIVTEGENHTRDIAKKCQQALIGCVDCKQQLLETLAVMIEPFQERRKELASKDAFVVDVLHEGGKRARAIIAKTVEEVREKIGIHIY